MSSAAAAGGPTRHALPSSRRSTVGSGGVGGRGGTGGVVAQGDRGRRGRVGARASAWSASVGGRVGGWSSAGRRRRRRPAARRGRPASSSASPAVGRRGAAGAVVGPSSSSSERRRGAGRAGPVVVVVVGRPGAGEDRAQRDDAGDVDGVERVALVLHAGQVDDDVVALDADVGLGDAAVLQLVADQVADDDEVVAAGALRRATGRPRRRPAGRGRGPACCRRPG